MDLLLQKINPTNLPPSPYDPCGFSKNLSPKKRVKPRFLVTFNIIFPENSI